MNQDLVLKLKDNGDIVGLVESPPMLYTNLHALYPDIEWNESVTPTQVESFGYGAYEWVAEPNINTLAYNQTVIPNGVQKQSDGFWRREFIIGLVSNEELLQITALRTNALSNMIRMLLKRSDYTQLPDASEITKLNIADWVKYRQDLRDINNQEGYPWNITLPTPLSIAPPDLIERSIMLQNNITSVFNAGIAAIANPTMAARA